MSCVAISGIGNRFSEYEGRTSQGESRKDQEKMSVSTLVRKSLSVGLSKLNWEIIPYGNGSFASTSTIQGLQQQQITGLSMRGSYEDTIVLHKAAKMELD